MLHRSPAIIWKGSGTHDGDFMGVPASRRRVIMPVCTVLDLKDGKIIAEREYMDMAHMMQQIGAAPVKASA